MFSPELQAALDEEINKAPEETAALIRGKEFEDTISLIAKVNKLDEAEKEALTLETIMLVLGVSDYETLEDALINQVIIAPSETRDTRIKQIATDLEEYVFKKLFHTQAPSKISIEVASEEGVVGKKTLRDAIITNKEGSLIRQAPQTETQETPIIREREPIGDVYREHVEESDKVIHVG